MPLCFADDSSTGPFAHVGKTRFSKVITSSHEANHIRKLPEVVLLSCPKRMLFEELDDSCQILHSTNPKFHPIAVVHDDGAAAKVRLHFLQDPFIPSVLYDPEFGQYLPT